MNGIYMFIQTENTPNPNSLKFMPDGDVINGFEPLNILRESTENRSPLAKELFQNNKITQVFIGYDFITITKTDDADWSLIKPEIIMVMMNYFISGRKVIEDQNKGSGVAIEEDPLSAQIREIIEHRVRPSVAQDGGDIVFRRFENGVVFVELYGACSGCPSSSITLKNGIESMLKHYVPEVLAVEQIYS